MNGFLDGLWLVRLIFQRGMAAIYLIAFVCALNQFRPLLGERGLLPVPTFVAHVRFRKAPSLFHFHYSDRFLACVAWTGIGLSVVALLGISEAAPWWLGTAVWLALFTLYLSIVNVGQTFYGFGWESMLLEAGFFAAFLGPSRVEPPALTILLLRWMLFRVELGAGLIKLRHDSCWRNLTCLFYHYETQPMPNAIAWYAHRLPRSMLAAGVAFSHFVQVICPFGLFAPQPIASVAGAFIILHQLVLILAGNYAWLNWLTVVLAVTAFSDAQLQALLPISVPSLEPRPSSLNFLIAAVVAATAILSVKPTLNFFSRHQAMNASYNPLHLVNAYGAFGAVTRERYEIVVEGTTEAYPSDRTVWKVFEFKGKPGDPKRRPPQVTPYHLRLDWLMWFIPLSVVRNGRILTRGVDLWFLRLVAKLLVGDRAVTSLLRNNPFRDVPCNRHHTRSKSPPPELPARRRPRRAPRIRRLRYT
jgi:Lipase maturation factor